VGLSVTYTYHFCYGLSSAVHGGMSRKGWVECGGFEETS
jgi:hypothetical protein